MNSGSISYRRCRKKDLVPSIKVIRSSFNHLRKQTGKEPLRWTVRGVPPFFEHLIKTDPKTFYCAWYKDKVIGFAGAIMRGKQWYLAWLFIHPRYQDKGVGGKLLEKVWREGKGITHALSTFAYNTQAVGLYSKFGMAPLCTVPLMYTKPDKLPKRKPTGLKIIDTLTKADYDWINNLEGKIRGYVRPEEWKFWKSSDRYKIYLFKDRGKRVGYSMTGTHGELAPAGAVSKKHLVNIVYEMLYLSNVKDDNTIRLFCPTHNIELYKMLLKNGLRMDEMLVFMSDTPYGDFDRYLPATLAIF